MKLDASDLRFLTADEFRILTATEMGSKNHEVVPASLIAQISGIRSGGGNKLMGQLARRNLIARVQNVKYDGYRLTYGGYDFLAIKAMTKRDSLASVGSQIGVGKESDIYIVADGEGANMCLKIHRLGRISFRAIKEKRDYMGKRKSASWMYMSRLAAQKEWAFLRVLFANGFPVPTPIDQSRHCILMSLQDAVPMRQISEHPNVGRLYSQLMDLLVRFARAGLIHGDFNEFNILIRREDGEPVVIDFPQMVSTRHLDAEWFFNRDVACIRTFFRRRFRYESKLYPRFAAALQDESHPRLRLDAEVEASGFGKHEEKTLEAYTAGLRESGELDGEEENSDEEEDDSEEYEEEGDESENEEDGETRAEEVERLAREAAEEDAAAAGSSSPKLPPRLVPADSRMAEYLSRLSLANTDVDELAPAPAAQTIAGGRGGGYSTSPPRSVVDLPPSSCAPTPSSSSSSVPPPNSSAPGGVSFSFTSPLPSTHPSPPSPTASVTPSVMSSRPNARQDRTESDLVRTQIAGDLVRERARTEARHHAKASVNKAGNAKGSKRKNETSARLMKAERSGKGGDGW